MTAITNRYLSREASQLPRSPKLQIVSGIDILTSRGVSGLAQDLESRVVNIEHVTHVYFFGRKPLLSRDCHWELRQKIAFQMSPDPLKERDVNVQLLLNAVSAVESVATNLEFVVLASGTKAYGNHLLEKFPFYNELPLKESLPRVDKNLASHIFYYDQHDKLAELSVGKSWSWSVIIPDLIVGFVPNNSIYCLAQVLGIFLSLYVDINGEGSEVPFPGTKASYAALSTESSQDTVAKIAVYSSLHPQKSARQIFNSGDSSVPTSWSQKWPIICEYFGLKGSPPSAQNPIDPSQYLVDHMEEWKEVERKHALKTGHIDNERSIDAFPRIMMGLFEFNRHQDMEKTYSMMGQWKEEADTRQTWWTAFDRLRAARVIP